MTFDILDLSGQVQAVDRSSRYQDESVLFQFSAKIGSELGKPVLTALLKGIPELETETANK